MTNEPPVVEVTGHGVLDVTVWRQKNSMTVHLVNLTNPMMMKGPLREMIQIGAQEVRVRLPDGFPARKAHLLVTGKTLRLERRERELRFTIPSILDHEIVAIDLA